jgi:phenylacetate-coenzyme A ligase PaaK-like adenylate-forming protein
MLLSHPHALQAFEAAQHELEQLEQSYFAQKEVESVKAEKLERLWERAITAPYYKHLVDLNPGHLSSLPVTPKSIVKKQPELFFAQKGKHIKYYESSGTSNKPQVWAVQDTRS